MCIPKRRGKRKPIKPETKHVYICLGMNLKSSTILKFIQSSEKTVIFLRLHNRLSINTYPNQNISKRNTMKYYLKLEYYADAYFSCFSLSTIYIFQVVSIFLHTIQYYLTLHLLSRVSN